MCKFIVITCLSLVAWGASAANINGIRIESDGIEMIVFIDGKQVCTPTLSCFIANLNSGKYLIEVYESIPSRYNHSNYNRGELLYRERFFYNAYTLQEITVRGINAPAAYDYDVMPPETFSLFLHSLKKEPFDDNRNKLIETTIFSTGFTSGQCLEMVKAYTFESGKFEMLRKVYPKIVDKHNFFLVVESFTFSREKEKANEIVKQYHQR